MKEREVIHEEAVGLPCDYAAGSSSGGSAPTTRPRTRRSWPRSKMAGPTGRRTRRRTRLGARTDGSAGTWLATHGPRTRWFWSARDGSRSDGTDGAGPRFRSGPRIRARSGSRSGPRSRPKNDGSPWYGSRWRRTSYARAIGAYRRPAHKDPPADAGASQDQ